MNNVDDKSGLAKEVLRKEIVQVLKNRHKGKKMKTVRKEEKQGKWFNPFIFVLVVIAITGLLGCENQVATKRGSVSGLVLDTAGNRVVGALVRSHRSLYGAETNEDGFYEFTSLDEGSHRLTVEQNGFYIASRTIEIGYGEVVNGINLEVEPLPEMITWSISGRTRDSAVIDISCKEAMSVQVLYREQYSMVTQSEPTVSATSHQIKLSNLFTSAKYLFSIEGVTADGRRYKSSEGSFNTIPREDLAGAPDMPSDFTVSQGLNGPVLNWSYKGLDPVKGFRLYKGTAGNSVTLIANEDEIFGAQFSYPDSLVVPGQLYQYAIQAVDLDGNVSSLTNKLSIFPAGKLTEDVVWKASYSPISINGDIWVPAGKTLTIEPGVIVKFSESDNARMGYNPEKCEFIVEGQLTASGTQDLPIKFISGSALPSRSDWNGIRVVSGADQKQTELHSVEISGAEEAVAVYESPVSISNLVSRYNSIGLGMHGASATTCIGLQFYDCETGFLAENTWNCAISSVIVNGAVDGIYLRGNSNFRLTDFDVRGTTENGLRAEDRLSPYVRGGVIQSEKVGFLMRGATGDYQFLTIDAQNGVVVDGADVSNLRNCILVNYQNPGSGNGIEEKTLGRSYPYNNIFNFAVETLNCDQNGGPIINADPHFVSIAGIASDYHLKNDSPILTSSDAKSQPGAYGLWR